MSLAAKMRHAPLRLVTGAYILQSGITKFSADESTHSQLHGAASGAYPKFGKMPPSQFGRMLAVGETALGAALLLPIVPTAVAGAGLMAFSGGLLGLYWKTPGMHGENDPRPTERGTVLAKDSWLFGIGTSLVLDSVMPETGQARALRRAERKAAKAEAKMQEAQHKGEKVGRAAQMKEDAKAAAKLQQKTAKASLKAQAKSAKAARKAARQAAEQAAKRATTATHAAAENLRTNVEKGAAAAGKAATAASKSATSAGRSAMDTARSAMDSAGSSARDAAAKIGV